MAAADVVRGLPVLWRVLITAATGEGLHSCDCSTEDVNTPGMSTDTDTPDHD